MSTKTMEKAVAQRTSLFTTNGTIFTIDFDFTGAVQNQILSYLQQNNYTLYGFKGATGPNQVTAGLPVWFAEPCQEMFGHVEIDYEPLYKVYVFNQAVIGANTTIQMQAMSAAVPLGTALTFNADGTFSASGTATPGLITVANNRPAGTNNVTIGLAAYVNGLYAPFCAFTCTPMGSVSMEPNETVCLFAAQPSLQSGSVIGNAAAPGCTFEFNASTISYNLEFIGSTYGITNAPGGAPVTAISSGASLIQLLNS
jgi:hypothetical protein